MYRSNRWRCCSELDWSPMDAAGCNELICHTTQDVHVSSFSLFIMCLASCQFELLELALFSSTVGIQIFCIFWRNVSFYWSTVLQITSTTCGSRPSMVPRYACDIGRFYDKSDNSGQESSCWNWTSVSLEMALAIWFCVRVKQFTLYRVQTLLFVTCEW